MGTSRNPGVHRRAGPYHPPTSSGGRSPPCGPTDGPFGRNTRSRACNRSPSLSVLARSPPRSLLQPCRFPVHPSPCCPSGNPSDLQGTSAEGTSYHPAPRETRRHPRIFPPCTPTPLMLLSCKYI